MSEHPSNSSIHIEESAVGSAIVSGDGNTVYVIHQATEQWNVRDSIDIPAQMAPNPYKAVK